MVLVDTSVWIEHIRKADPVVVRLSETRRLVTHPVVIGELAVGSYKSRKDVLAAIRQIPCVAALPIDDCLDAIERFRLWGKGLGWGDLQILLSAHSAGVRIYTYDGPLLRVLAETGEFKASGFTGLSPAR